MNYPPPAPNLYPQRDPGQGLALAAIICGAIGVLIGLVPILFFVAGPLGVVAMILSWVAVNRRTKIGLRPAECYWGLILGGVAFIFACIGYVVVGNVLSDAERDLDCISEANTVEQINACND